VCDQTDAVCLKGELCLDYAIKCRSHTCVSIFFRGNFIVGWVSNLALAAADVTPSCTLYRSLGGKGGLVHHVMLLVELNSSGGLVDYVIFLVELLDTVSRTRYHVPNRAGVGIRLPAALPRELAHIAAPPATITQPKKSTQSPCYSGNTNMVFHSLILRRSNAFPVLST
jgi:hypothetical protein